MLIISSSLVAVVVVEPEGGGGGGGFLPGTTTVSASTNYTVTVGGGGNATNAIGPNPVGGGLNGSPSIFGPGPITVMLEVVVEVDHLKQVKMVDPVVVEIMHHLHQMAVLDKITPDQLNKDFLVVLMVDQDHITLDLVVVALVLLAVMEVVMDPLPQLVDKVEMALEPPSQDQDLLVLDQLEHLDQHQQEELEVLQAQQLLEDG